MSLTDEDYELGKNDLYKAIQHLTFYIERFYNDGLYNNIAQGGKFEVMIELYAEYFEICDQIDQQAEIAKRKDKNESE